MTPLTTVTTPLADISADVVAGFVATRDEAPMPSRALQRVATDAGLDLAQIMRTLHVTGRPDDVLRVPLTVGGRTLLALLIGVGPDAAVDANVLRRAAARAARNATKDATLAVLVPGDLGGDVSDEVRGQVLAEGLGLGSYAYTVYRSKSPDAPSLERILLVSGDGVDGDAVTRGADRGWTVARAANIARDLINTPPAFKRPPELAQRVADLAHDAGLRARIHSDVELAEGGFGGLLGAGRGSAARPRLVELSYDGVGADNGHIVLVGKGVTFDSGGLSLKSSEGMKTMKSDMSGAAAVAGALLAAAELRLAPRVTGLLALAENMPSGEATRVSDVLTHRNGTTVEVLNTDAEGRLVLADALAYGQELQPTAMVDIATLTGAQVVALGNRIAAIMTTDDRLRDGLIAAGEATGEALWPLPLPPEYREHLHSEVADLRNIGRPREAAAIVAGLFLKEFVGDVPWAHLDIAGPAFNESGDGGLIPKGGSGFGVRLLVRYLETVGSQAP